jgi:hypothetical protein
METLSSVFLVLLVGVAVVLATSWHFSRGRDLVRRWAAREGYVLVSAKHAFFRGPFWWRSGDGNVVHRVVVRDRDDSIRKGHVRCGGLFLGMLSDEATVIWD